MNNGSTDWRSIINNGEAGVRLEFVLIHDSDAMLTSFISGGLSLPCGRWLTVGRIHSSTLTHTSYVVNTYCAWFTHMSCGSYQTAPSAIYDFIKNEWDNASSGGGRKCPTCPCV